MKWGGNDRLVKQAVCGGERLLFEGILLLVLQSMCMVEALSLVLSAECGEGASPGRGQDCGNAEGNGWYGDGSG